MDISKQMADINRICKKYDMLEGIASIRISGFDNKGPFAYPFIRLSNRREIARDVYLESIDSVWEHRDAQQTLDNHKRLQAYLDTLSQ